MLLFSDWGLFRKNVGSVKKMNMVRSCTKLPTASDARFFVVVVFFSSSF